MLHFTVDDPQAPVNGCHTCCCEKLSLKPGTINKVSVGYAPWAVPIGQLHCLPQFSLELMDTCPVPASGAPVVTETPHYDVTLDTALTEDLSDFVEDAQGDPLVFKALSLYGPKYGQLALNADGGFTYTPSPGYRGADRFFASVTDGNTPPVIFEVLLGVDTDSAAIKPTPHVSIDQNAVVLDPRWYTVSFPIRISPAASLCEVWRLTVLQAALDCDCSCFQRTDCFDIGIAKC